MRQPASQALRGWWRHVSATAILCAGGWLWAAPAPPADSLSLDLEYKVFVRGVRVGAAHIRSETSGGRYRVCGLMHTTNVWARIAPWESRFDVRGRIEEERAVPEELHVHTRAGKKRDRRIHVTDGVLRQVREGETQEEVPAPEGVDFVSFFWVTALCDAELVLNNGRRLYPMMLRERMLADDGTETCDYEVLDDDGDASPAGFVVVERHGRRVAKTVNMPAKLRRQLRLVDASVSNDAQPAACSLPDLGAGVGGQ